MIFRTRFKRKQGTLSALADLLLLTYLIFKSFPTSYVKKFKFFIRYSELIPTSLKILFKEIYDHNKNQFNFLNLNELGENWKLIIMESRY